MVELFPQFAFVDQMRQGDRLGAIDQAKAHICVGAIPKNRLAHQELVKIRVYQRADDWINLPLVIVHAGCNIHWRPRQVWPCLDTSTGGGLQRVFSHLIEFREFNKSCEQVDFSERFGQEPIHARTDAPGLVASVSIRGQCNNACIGQA